MGRRKGRKAVKKTNIPKLPTQFSCPFCSHENSVSCKMDRKRSVGKLECRVCSAEYQTQISHLSDPIDVFSAWIDECERVNKKAIEEGDTGDDFLNDEKEEKTERNDEERTKQAMQELKEKRLQQEDNEDENLWD